MYTFSTLFFFSSNGFENVSRRKRQETEQLGSVFLFNSLILMLLFAASWNNEITICHIVEPNHGEIECLKIMRSRILISNGIIEVSNEVDGCVEIESIAVIIIVPVVGEETVDLLCSFVLRV